LYFIITFNPLVIYKTSMFYSLKTY